MLWGPHPHSAGPCYRVLLASGVETTQQAVRSPTSRRRGGEQGHQGNLTQTTTPRGASGDSDDADEAQTKRCDQRTQKAADQVLTQLHPGHLCPSYAPSSYIPSLNADSSDANRQSLRLKVSSSKMTRQQTLQDCAPVGALESTTQGLKGTSVPGPV